MLLTRGQPEERPSGVHSSLSLYTAGDLNDDLSIGVELTFPFRNILRIFMIVSPARHSRHRKGIRHWLCPVSVNRVPRKTRSAIFALDLAHAYTHRLQINVPYSACACVYQIFICFECSPGARWSGEKTPLFSEEMKWWLYECWRVRSNCAFNPMSSHMNLLGLCIPCMMMVDRGLMIHGGWWKFYWCRWV